jgi:hypothetical protein
MYVAHLEMRYLPDYVQFQKELVICHWSFVICYLKAEK